MSEPPQPPASAATATADAVSVVVPLFNEAANVPTLAAELGALAPQLPGLEILFVDDGSSDDTWAAIERAQAVTPGLRGIRCPRNRGQSHAMLRGLREARGTVLVTLDGDLQNDPADIPELLRQLEGVDAVCGYRAQRRDTWSRRAASRLANRVRQRFTRDGMRDTGCSLKVFRRALIADLPPLDGTHRFMPAYFAMHGRRLTEAPVNHRARRHGVSKYTNWQRLPRTLFDLLGFCWYRRRFLHEEG